MPTPYYQDEQTTLYLGDCREILPELELQADLVCTDPPYDETKLAWDQWPDGWPTLAATAATSMWCFGSMRMFLQYSAEFTAADWKLSQDVVWQKNAGTGFAADRFKRVHEHALHWYRGPWHGIHHEAIYVPRTGPARNGIVRRAAAPHLGGIGQSAWIDNGERLATSVLQAKNLHGRALHPTEKPVGGLLDPLIRYACPPGGMVLDLFAGSGSTLDAARLAGRRAVGIEANEVYIERAARRLSQMPFPTSHQDPA